MCSMCHYCGAELNSSKPKEDSGKQGNENALYLNNAGPIWSCELCQEKLGRHSAKNYATTPYARPMISPTSSLSSSDRSFSSCSDFSVDITSCDRGDPEECTTVCGHENINHRVKKGQLPNSMSADSVNRMDWPNGVAEKNLRDTKSLNDIDVLRDVEITQTTSDVDGKDNVGVSGISNEETGISQNVDSEKDTEVWEPPEPEDPEADLEGTISYDDDEDDECGDGTNWGKPCSLSHIKEEGNGSYRFKEEKRRAMGEVTNGKFKAIVSQLLRSLGVSTSLKDGESWVDIVTCLSWEAASFLKIDAIDGKAAGPDGYVKVKCIATGTRGQSQLIKGLVFKKHVAHKHMPTKYKNPRLLLIQGALGQSSSGLSSFDSMEQEKDNLKSLMEVIDMCHPNVILVEKSVSRDVQESILAKGITLVFDMKLHRLERVAHCTGSPIITPETLMNTKQMQSDLFKQCDSFYIEKFIEEHASLGEGGRRPSKTLMFLEGCPTRLGCTILLKGSHSEELKKIKYAVQCSVVMAYHLILETSFLVDQKAMLSTVPFARVRDVFPNGQLSEPLGAGNPATPVDGAILETVASTEIPILNGFHEESSHVNGGTDGTVGNEGSDINSAFSFEPYNPAVFSRFSSLSASVKKVIGNNFSFGASGHCQSLSTYLGFNGGETNGQISNTIPLVESSTEQDPHDRECRCSEEEKTLVDGQSLSASLEVPHHMEIDHGREDESQSKEDINGVPDSQSILVLMSSRNALRGTICEQSHFSHIMFYRNFDVPLGKFLRDNLLNQRSKCSTCGELPEAHFYYYAHHNKQLTIQVKRIPNGNCVPGEADGKLWMWSRCGKCKPEKNSKSSKRVLISTAACGLSFGKFLELSFSEHSSSSRSASCGHLLPTDFLYFFGLGPMVAMFRYSFVTTYEVSLPPQMLEFSDSIRTDWLKEELENVYMKGLLLFGEVGNSLAQIRSQFLGSALNLLGSLKDFSDVEEMLKKETTDFEVNIHNAIAKDGGVCYKVLFLNKIRWDLLLESYVWDRRLHSLVLPDPTVVVAGVTKNSGVDGFAGLQNEALELKPGSGDKAANSDGIMEVQAGISSEANQTVVREIPVDSSNEESGSCLDLHNTSATESIDKSTNCGGSQNSASHQADGTELNHLAPNSCANNGTTSKTEDAPLLDHMQDRTIPISSCHVHDSSVVGFGASGEGLSPHSPLSGLEEKDGWFWMPFSEIRHICVRDLQKSHVPKFGSVSKYAQEHMPAGCQLVSEEGSRLHIPLGTDNSLVSDYEGELSSIIACALALLKDQPVPMESSDDGSRRDRVIESPHGLIRIPTSTSPHWSFSGSTDLDSAHSFLSSSSGESRLSSFDGLNLLDVLFSSDACNIEVSLGSGKSLGKSKYSVLCLYASQFRDLRNWCCPSELDYIASLSRCRSWDAKGGKSKCVFAKTVDDRFIIKEIKKTEYESFVKFAPHYFKHMMQSFELGNQTCLAKVLGIYQVTQRVPKSGKELRHDLMVMENLSFGRSIARQYDLKGALHARFNTAVDGAGDVLLDQNFVNDMNSSPLYVSNKAKRLLQRAVWNDTRFLNSINVMDYSLLVGVDTQRRELVCGIIDYLRQYTWDKQLETWVKSSLVVPKNVLPTVISPKEYKKRFRKFMSTHFLSVPDHWCSDASSDPCELCHSGSGSDDSSQSKSLKQEHRSGCP